MKYTNEQIQAAKSRRQMYAEIAKVQQIPLHYIYNERLFQTDFEIFKQLDMESSMNKLKTVVCPQRG